MTTGTPTEPTVETINDNFQQPSGLIKVLSNLARDIKGLIGKPDTFISKLGGLPTKICYDSGAGTNVVDKKWASAQQVDIKKRVILLFCRF